MAENFSFFFLYTSIIIIIIIIIDWTALLNYNTVYIGLKDRSDLTAIVSEHLQTTAAAIALCMVRVLITKMILYSDRYSRTDVAILPIPVQSIDTFLSTRVLWVSDGLDILFSYRYKTTDIESFFLY